MKTDTMTYVAWIHGHGVAEMSGIVYSRNMPGGWIGTGINWGPGDTLHYAWNTNSPQVYTWDGGPKMPRDKWAMVALAIEPTRATAYVYTDESGLKQSVNELPHRVQNVNTIRIGWDSITAYRYFRGFIDDVRIYNYALSRTELDTICSGIAGK